MGVNDLWIAAVALANGLPVVTRDSGFDVLAELGALEVIRVELSAGSGHAERQPNAQWANLPNGQ